MRVTLVLMLALLATPAHTQDANKNNEMVTIKVDKDLPIAEFLDHISAATGRPLLYDPNGQRIRGQKMGQGFSHNVPKERVFDTFRAILAFFELNLVPIGPKGHEIYLVLDSRSTNNFVKNKAVFVDHGKLDAYADKDGMYIASAVPIRHIENLTTLRTALSTMVSPAGIGRVHEVPGSQSIIIMDFAPTVHAMAQLIKKMDVPPTGTERTLAVIELKHAVAKDLASAVNETLANTPPPAAPGRRGYVPSGAGRIKPRVVPYAARNALLVTCMKSDYKGIRELVATLDKPMKRLESVESR